MATKKSSNSEPEKKEAPVKVAEKAPAPVVLAVEDPIMPVEKYLMSVGVRADHVAAQAVWAKSKGLTVATVSQWKKLFESF